MLKVHDRLRAQPNPKMPIVRSGNQVVDISVKAVLVRVKIACGPLADLRQASDQIDG
jgi:hypothetical protein